MINIGLAEFRIHKTHEFYKQTIWTLSVEVGLENQQLKQEQRDGSG